MRLFVRNRLARFLLPAVILFFMGAEAYAQQAGEPQSEADEDGDEIAREIERMVLLMKEDPLKATGERAIRKLESEYGEGFFKFIFDDGLVPRPYLVAVQLRENADPDTVSEQLGEILGHLHAEFSRRYGGMLEMEQINSPVVVFVFESELKFIELATSRPELGLMYFPGLGGYFNTGTEILYTWDKPDHWEVLFHEGTHQLMHHASKKWNPSPLDWTPWLQEGIAELFGGHTRQRSHDEKTGEWSYEFTFGQPLKGRHQAAKRAIYAGEAMSVREILELGFANFMEARAKMQLNPAQVAEAAAKEAPEADQEAVREATLQAAQEMAHQAARTVDQTYCLGWALVMYLNQGQEGSLQPAFRQLVRAEGMGQLTVEKFAELLLLETDEDWEYLNEDFRNWVTSELGR